MEEELPARAKLTQIFEKTSEESSEDIKDEIVDHVADKPHYGVHEAVAPKPPPAVKIVD